MASHRNTSILPLDASTLPGFLQDSEDDEEEENSITTHCLAGFSDELLTLLQASSTSSPPTSPHPYQRKQAATPRKSMRSALIPGKDNHILRERQIRDDMSSKFGALESLLPSPNLKRDRTAIVDDTIQFIRKMNAKLKELEEMKIAGKRLRSDVSSYDNFIFSDNIPQLQSTIIPPHCITDAFGPWHEEDDELQCAIYSEMSTISCNGLPKISVHKIPGNQILINITSELRPSFLTRLITAIEDLDMDVANCNLCKAPPQISCILLTKLIKPNSGKEIMPNKVVEVIERALSSFS